MRTLVKRSFALLLTLALVLCLFGCSASQTEPSDSPAGPEDTANTDGEEFGSYTIGTSVHGSGVWIIDLIRMWATSYLEEVGMTTTWTSCNFNSEQMVNDVSNLIQSGVDGEMYMNVFGVITPAINDKLEEGQVPWVTYAQPILDDQIEMVRANPYYMGNVTPDMSTLPTLVSQAALEDGHKKAIIFTAAIGDVVNDMINDSIQEVFEAGGGQILEVIHCSDNSEAITKADDVVAAYGDQIDMAFAANMDYTNTLLNALEKFGYEDIPIYSFSADAAAIDLIAEGKLVATGVAAHDAIFAGALLLNALDGHKLVDADGNVPHYTSVSNGVINEQNADAYLKYYINGTPVPMEDYKHMLYRYNPDITYDEFIQTITSYNDVDYVISRNSSEG